MKKSSMKKALTVLTLVLGCTWGSQQASAQVDPHFTQYYIYPSWTNSALTGSFDGSYRVSGIFRTQWGNIGVPFLTQGLSAEFTTDKNLNYGVSFMNQTAGDGGYRYTTMYGNIAFTGLRFGPIENHRIVFGMQAGFIQRRFDVNKLNFQSQYNAVTGLPDKPSGEILQTPRSGTFDAGAGVMYFDATPGKKVNFYGGYSASHLTRPTDRFLGSSVENSKLPMRHLLHAGARIRLNDQWNITPNALYMTQGTAKETMIGFYSQYKATAETDLMAGANYRINDAISPFLGFSHKRFVLGLSYDINASDLGKLAKASNSFEISMAISGRRNVKTPEVEFVCPRL
jgi:type IX secretion system PorP/SprF family membrane protein